jgi:hypothetical protein
MNSKTIFGILLVIVVFCIPFAYMYHKYYENKRTINITQDKCISDYNKLSIGSECMVWDSDNNVCKKGNIQPNRSCNKSDVVSIIVVVIGAFALLGCFVMYYFM